MPSALGDKNSYICICCSYHAPRNNQCCKMLCYAQNYLVTPQQVLQILANLVLILRALLVLLVKQACTWFLKLLCWFAYIYVSTSKASGMICTPYNWLNKLYSFYVAAVIHIVSGCGWALKRIVETNLIRVSHHCYLTVVWNSCA